MLDAPQGGCGSGADAMPLLTDRPTRRARDGAVIKAGSCWCNELAARTGMTPWREARTSGATFSPQLATACGADLNAADPLGNSVESLARGEIPTR